MSELNISTIGNPEFINLEPLDVNPLMSACEIKVLYVGKNRNHSYISKEVATEMSKTLRGAPIVGYYKEDAGDFRDHGDQLVIDEEGVRFNCLTKPYGFVAPDAKVWFQKFQEKDEFGEDVEREYLMTTGYLWTGQFAECKVAVDQGRPHSMELDEKTLDGEWSEDFKTGMSFFIINDAIFSKLCILGEDVEPCFEGSSVTAPEISANFTRVDDTFKRTLFTMMEELKFALQEGGATVEKVDETVVVEEETQPIVEENFSNEEDKVEQTVQEENEETMNEEGGDGASEEPETQPAEDYSLLQTQYNELNEKYEKLQKDYDELVAFKNQIENEKKDALIETFTMLSDEDKKEVIENKEKYSLDEIEAKLSVIYTKKQFALEKLENESKQQEENNNIQTVVTYNLNEEDNVPDWVKAAREVEKALNS